MNIGIYFRMTNHVAPVERRRENEIFQISLNKIITGSRDIFILEKESSSQLIKYM